MLIQAALQYLGIHRVMGWFGMKGTLEIILFQLPALGRATFHWTRLLRAISSLLLYLLGGRNRCGNVYKWYNHCSWLLNFFVSMT